MPSVASIIHQVSFSCLSLHLLVKPVSQSLCVPLKPADIFLHIVQGNLSSPQLKCLLFDGLKEQLHLGVKHTHIYKHTYKHTTENLMKKRSIHRHFLFLQQDYCTFINA